ncbi:MAG: M28 family peptidase [Bacteroidetes bacterium]|nr:M28 family peptidase [Bacteroidota bacterium]
MKKIFIAVLLLSNISFAQTKKQIKKIAETITTADLKAKLTVIAGKDMEGRETATPGQQRAAAYIENSFKELGLQPGMPDGYQLYYPVFQDSITGTSLEIGGKQYSVNTDFAYSFITLEAGHWTADSIIFAGFGIQDSTRNDYAHLDIKGKWVMVLAGLPADIHKSADAVKYNFRSPGSYYQKAITAKNNGAAGILIIEKDFPKKNLAPTKGNMYLTKKNTSGNNPLIFVSPKVAASILGISTADFSGLQDIPEKAYPVKFAYSVQSTTLDLRSSNVIGVLPGTDKKDEYVFITAHYDHLGKRDSVIWYGADDDGSGTTSVIELAEAFMKARKKGYGPRRTIVFMTVSGEEKGLWGSAYYTDHPVFPLDKTSVDLNIDMVGRLDPKRVEGDSTNYIYTIGEDKLSSDLMKISDSINHTYLNMELDRRFNDPKDPNRFYYRSDHYNFAKNGVPVIFYFNGTHADYHQPTDTIDKINFDVMAKRVKLVFYTAWDMANRDSMLVRDIPLK